MLPADALAKVESSILGETPGPGLQFESNKETTRTHTFHSAARIVESDNAHPLNPDFASQAFLKLPEEGGFRSHFVDGYQAAEGISFKSAYMQVAGTHSSKTGYGWVTLATAVITGLNIGEILTADLVFAQVSTEHPLIGYVPSVSFLGTRFENLKIAGRQIEPVIDLDICGPKPAGDAPYVKDSAFLRRVSEQYERISGSAGLSDSARQQYHWDPEVIAQRGNVECSLVTSVPQAIPGASYGHVLEVEGFGKVSLGSLTVDRAFTLNMITADLGHKGVWKFPPVAINGKTKP
jgi:hypothetical protein